MSNDMQPNNAVAKAQPTQSERFTAMVVKEFGANMGGQLELSKHQKRLSQHLFIAIDVALRNLEVKRAEKNPNAATITWANTNMTKVAVDSVHRIELGLDALIPNHLHIIPYWNKRLEKYDLDLQVGYTGKDYYRRSVAVDKPVDIIYELVYSNDKFVPIKKSAKNPVESYEFEIVNPFDRGEVVGGFGYVMYEKPEMNKLIIVTKRDFDKSKNKARGGTFWNDHAEAMQYKTIVNRVTSKLNIDPEKIGLAYAEVEASEYEAQVEREVERNANQEVIDIEPQAQEEAPPVNGAGQTITESAQEAAAGPGF
jgi:recombination protein RecT